MREPGSELSLEEPGTRTRIISLWEPQSLMPSSREGREKKREGRVVERETICTSLKGVGGAGSGSSDPSPSAASRREKQFTLPSGLRITFECWRGTRASERARSLFPAVNCHDNEILGDFRARLFALTKRDQFPFGKRIFSFFFFEHYLSNLGICRMK